MAGSATAVTPITVWRRKIPAWRCPIALSYVDGALVACGFGTVYEALNRVARLRPGPRADHGRRAGGHGRRADRQGDGRDRWSSAPMSPQSRLDFALAAARLTMLLSADAETVAGGIKQLTQGQGCEVTIDCSGSPAGRLLALQGTRRWGRCALVGEGNTVEFDVSQTIIHNQITVYGSWVTSLGHMEDLVEKLVAGSYSRSASSRTASRWTRRLKPIAWRTRGRAARSSSSLIRSGRAGYGHHLFHCLKRTTKGAFHEHRATFARSLRAQYPLGP